MHQTHIPRPTVLQKLQYLLLIYTLKVLYAAIEFILPYTPKRHLIGTPTHIRHYPPLPTLPVHLYLPPSSSPTTKKLPLYISIHGGGFIYGSPFKDSGFCASRSKNLNLIVAAISYRKAPRHKYPTQLQDVATLIRCVFLDPAVEGVVDRERVMVGGFSAGAVLALQVPRVVKEVRWRAVVAWYPAVDYSEAGAEDEVKGGGGGSGDEESGDGGSGKKEKEGKGWLLRKCVPAFAWAVVPDGMRLDDPSLSAMYADPWSWKRLLVVCGTDDVLWNGCERFMDKLMRERGGGGATRREVGDGWRERRVDEGRIGEIAVVDERHSFTHRRSEEPGVKAVVKRVDDWMRDILERRV